MKTACVILAEGFEEVEAITPIDYLRRAGIAVTVLGLGSQSIAGAHGVKAMADSQLAGTQELFDAIVIPGGMPGSANIAASPVARSLILKHHHEKKLVAAICAAPAYVLHESCGILAGRKFTGYPGTETKVSGGAFSPERIVVDGNIITARAAGCAAEFSFAIISYLVGAEVAAKIEAAVLAR